MEFKRLDAEAVEEVAPFFGRRPNKTCDSVFLDSYLWKDYYKVRYAIGDNKAVLWLMEQDGMFFSAMPVCAQEDLQYYFEKITEYFNRELHCPLRMHLADEEAVKYLGLEAQTWKFRVAEQSDLKDYLYDGDKMRTLSGKKLHKKKNHLNYFKKAYEGRYEYRTICCSDKEAVWKFLAGWRENKGEDAEEHLDYEVQGIHDILKNCSCFQVRMGGVYIDGRLEAFSLGSYNAFEDMAVIHIEKANPEIRGLYQFINQQFLIHEFPRVHLVNREDDLGIEGLRKAKLSYAPTGFALKYKVEQIDFQKREEQQEKDALFGNKSEKKE